MLEPSKKAAHGLLDRRAFGRRCDAEIAKAERKTAPLSVIICDLDRFRRVNDEAGHLQGDLELRIAADAISKAVRNVDEVAGLGGDHFAVLLPGADELEAIEVAERVRVAVREALAPHPVPVTISCGVSTFGAASTREQLIRTADAALHDAKRRGRDRTVAAAASGAGAEKRVVFAL